MSPTTALGFEQSVGNTSSTAPSPKLRQVSCLLFFYRQALSPLLFCFVPVLQECSKHFLVRNSQILHISTKKTLFSEMSRFWSDVRHMHSYETRSLRVFGVERRGGLCVEETLETFEKRTTELTRRRFRTPLPTIPTSNIAHGSLAEPVCLYSCHLVFLSHCKSNK